MDHTTCLSIFSKTPIGKTKISFTLLGKKNVVFPGVRTSALLCRNRNGSCQLAAGPGWAWALPQALRLWAVSRCLLPQTQLLLAFGCLQRQSSLLSHCPTRRSSVVTVRSRFLEMFGGDFEVSQALGCSRLGHLREAVTGCLAGGSLKVL